jgi:hypothetical protein
MEVKNKMELESTRKKEEVVEDLVKKVVHKKKDERKSVKDVLMEMAR